jgi:cytochrome c biogenesis protein CcmG/thiol:disulfide interchange protein DsbE
MRKSGSHHRRPGAARARRPRWSAGGRAALAALFALAALTVAGCGEDGDGGESGSAPDYERALRGAPPPLAALYERGDVLVKGGTEAFAQQLEELRGFPVVINNWASWCGPCRVEWPFFQREAAERGTEVAFLGVNSNDGDDAAETFLRDQPLPYPSFFDPDEEIREEFLDRPISLPATAFYDSKGRLAYVHQGQYAERDQLAADIERYAQ